MQTGIYEQLITSLFEKKLQKIKTNYHIQKQALNPQEAATYLSRHLTQTLQIALETYPLYDNERVQKQLELSNSLIEWLSETLKETTLTENLLETKGELLKALYFTENPVAQDLKAHINKITPLTGLTQSELFTGSHAGLSLESEIKREIQSSDEINWLVSFIKWTGIRIFTEELKKFAKSGRKIKIITTSYMGATDPKAIDFLSTLPNSEIKLSYNSGNERLHAKTYIFKRNSGFDTAYIGSSNISRSALTNGLEWNLKVTTKEIPHIIKKFKSTFETYWVSPDFETYDHRKEENRVKLTKSLKQGRGEGFRETELFFDITPHIHQKEILEKLIVERIIHGRYRNLVVAATGTGKTVISAFDFKNFNREHPGAKLLYVAHREEILKQSRAMFRAVLRDFNFGELWVGGAIPGHYNQLFASVQTLNNNADKLANFSADFFDFIIIDEVHHIVANSYRPILEKFTPQILLGLTATPERADGGSILPDFYDTIAAELRLPDAINQRHLCPFQYFGIDDTTDISQVKWVAGRYAPSELTNVFTADTLRVGHILRNMDDIIGDLRTIKALAYCVTQDHAQYMTDRFNAKGVKSAVLTSKNSTDRVLLIQQLKQGEINVLFVVDIFNEGIDIPEIDTLLFLRPTESLTIFLQQLGRGLRLSDNKDCLTVLDFVGNGNAHYDFATKFRALVGKSHRSTIDEVQDDFPHLPLGCSIVLQKQTKEVILANIRGAILNGKKLKGLISSFSEQTTRELTLKNFLFFNPTVTLEDIYKIGWNKLNGADEREGKMFDRAISTRFITCRSRSYLNFLLNLLSDGFKWDETDELKNQMALMAFYDFWQQPGENSGFSTLNESLLAIDKSPKMVRICIEALEKLLDRIDISESPMDLGFPIALQLHGRYSRDQILAAFGENNFEKKSSSREGVLFIEKLNCELLFVTLNKIEKHYSPTTLYNDYAINEYLFHWQTQNSARPDRGKGLSYINHREEEKKIILFVREQNKDENGRTMSYVNLGLVNLDSFSGKQPMNITWKLEEALPPYLWDDVAKLAIG